MPVDILAPTLKLIGSNCSTDRKRTYGIAVLPGRRNMGLQLMGGTGSASVGGSWLLILSFHLKKKERKKESYYFNLNSISSRSTNRLGTRKSQTDR